MSLPKSLQVDTTCRFCGNIHAWEEFPLDCYIKLVQSGSKLEPGRPVVKYARLAPVEHHHTYNS